MSGNADQPDLECNVSEKEDRRAARARAKDQRRADRVAARARRQAEAARLEDETAGRLSGIRVFKDGTVQKEPSSSSPLMNAAVRAWRDRLSQSGLVSDSSASRRSALLDVTLTDRRIRKPFARARSAVHIGLISTGKDHFGSVTLKIAARDWTETLTASSEEGVAELLALKELLREVMDARAQVAAGGATRAPLPPPAASGSVATALRELRELHDEGLVTDEEFESRRQALVAQLSG